eukprot:g21500.t1
MRSRPLPCIGWASAEPATSIGAGRSFQPREPNIGGMPSQQQGVDSLGQRAQPVQQEVQVWRLRVGILNAEGAPFIDPMQFHSAYVICSLCGEDPQSDAVELFRTHAVGYSGQASWNIEEDLLDYQPPDGLELSVVCQGAGNSEWLLGSARLQHRQFFPLGCNTRLTLVRAAEGIQGTLWVKVLVMEDNGTPVSEAPLQEPSPPKKQQQWAVHPGYHEAGSFANATGRLVSKSWHSSHMGKALGRKSPTTSGCCQTDGSSTATATACSATTCLCTKPASSPYDASNDGAQARLRLSAVHT